MANIKLKDRIEGYISNSDVKLLNKLPVIIYINGRGFSKITSLLDKPFSMHFSQAMLATMLKLCSEIEGAIFGFSNHDEIIIVSRNDQSVDSSPWFDNKIQKISSISSSLATYQFNAYAKSINLSIIGEALFTSQIFSVPNITETVNSLIYFQQKSMFSSVQYACFYELLKKYDKNTIKEMLNGLSVDEKIDLLSQECGIDYNSYSVNFRKGSACYKSPKIIDNIMKNKWIINNDIPIFSKDQQFVNNIISNGVDIFRGDVK